MLLKIHSLEFPLVKVYLSENVIISHLSLADEYISVGMEF